MARTGLWEWDVAQDRVYLDPNLEDLLGFPEDEAPRSGESWFELVHPADRPGLDRAIHECVLGRAPLFEHERRVLTHDGRQLWMLTRGVAARDPSGRVRVTATDMDITARKLADESAEAERRRLYTLMDRLPAFVCLIGPDHSVRFANRWFQDEFGSDLSQPCHKMMHGLDSPCDVCPTMDVFETGTLAVWEWDCPGKDKTFQIFDYPFEDVDGSPLALELGIDVTRLKKASRALRISEERYRSITDNLPLGVMVVDQSLRVAAANPRLREWLPGLGSEAAPLAALLFPPREENQPPIETALAAALRGEDAAELAIESELNGERRFFRIACRPMAGPRGEPRQVLVMVEDETEKRKVLERLMQAQRIQHLSALTAGVAHEINQPLNALRLYVSGLEMMLEKEGAMDRAAVLDRLGWVLAECDKIRDIITHMRALARQDGSAETGAVDANRAVRSALALVETQLANHGVALALDLDERLPLARANAVQLEQVLVNLAVNAMQALDEADAIGDDATMENRSVEGTDKRLQVSSRLERGRAVLRVLDNGPGLDGAGDRVFDPFFTTKESGKGMGLGLSIVHAMVSSWGGEISASDNELGGATFTVTMELAQVGSTNDAHPAG